MLDKVFGRPHPRVAPPHEPAQVSWSAVLRSTFREIQEDNCLGLAAQLAYYFFLALFPALLFLVALAGTFFVDSWIAPTIDYMAGMAPPAVLEIFRDQLTKISQGDTGGILTIGVAGALWSSSTAMVAIIDAMNSAYDLTESRSWWRVRLAGLLLTLALAVFVLLSSALVILGPSILEAVASRVSLDQTALLMWDLAQWPLVLTLMVVGILLVYRFAPDAPDASRIGWRWLMPGALLAAGLWLVASIGFRTYVTNFGNYTETYGTLGGVIVLMLWLYLFGLAILVGAELNSELDHAKRGPVTQQVEEQKGRDAGQDRGRDRHHAASHPHRRHSDAPS